MSKPSRFVFLDLLRALAAQLIVLHHLAFYGPLSDTAYDLAPGAIDWLYNYGRFAVQVFFVLSGYCLAMGRLSRRPPVGWRETLRVIADRYLRIGLPYLVALGLALVANEVAASYMSHPSISPRPTPGQLAAHLVLLHKVLGYESVTAGIWYVAIDVQLFALVALVYAVSARLFAQRGAMMARWILLGLGALSLFFWNRSPNLDCYALYFLGSYVVGMSVAWLKDGSLSRVAFWSYLGVVVLALQVDFRARLVVSAVTAAVLALVQGRQWLTGMTSPRPLRMLADMSYSLFLVHFPICLVLNTWWSSHLPATPGLALVGMVVAWALSLSASVLFYHFVEKRLSGLRLSAPRTAARRVEVVHAQGAMAGMGQAGPRKAEQAGPLGDAGRLAPEGLARQGAILRSGRSTALGDGA
jgi:peptidoglycan/LPS O-acetylase OafA/YrhL